MLLANSLVAEKIFTSTDHHLGIYRTHATPSIDRVEELHTYLSGLGYPTKMVRGVIPPASLRAILQETKSDIERDAISLAIARSMQKALYTVTDTGHFGLALEHYTHFTSPIRRYPDVMVHRMLQDIIDGNPTSKRDALKLEGQAKHSTCLLYTSDAADD